jgi:hypothetical protein
MGSPLGRRPTAESDLDRGPGRRALRAHRGARNRRKPDSALRQDNIMRYVIATSSEHGLSTGGLPHPRPEREVHVDRSHSPLADPLSDQRDTHRQSIGSPRPARNLSALGPGATPSWLALGSTQKFTAL